MWDQKYYTMFTVVHYMYTISEYVCIIIYPLLTDVRYIWTGVHYLGVTEFTVKIGMANAPSLKLFEKFGFAEVRS